MEAVSETPMPPWTLRHIAKPPCLDVLVHFAQNGVEFASGDVALHLLIPFVIFPTVQPRRELNALFERKLPNGFFYLIDAHVNESVRTQPRGVDRHRSFGPRQSRARLHQAKRATPLAPHHSKQTNRIAGRANAIPKHSALPLANARS